MMKSAILGLSLLSAWGLVAAGAAAGEVTLTGKILCAKCSLKETPKCTTAIQVKEGGKTVTYYLLDKGAAEEYHEPVCGSGVKDGKVTGTVSEKAGKKWITPKKVEYATAAKKDALMTTHWCNDYAMARMEGKQEGKPLAVFIGSGPDGWQKVTTTGTLSAESQQVLTDSYVALYVDTATAVGRQLAGAFDMSGGLGIVVSDRSGETQIFAQQGALDPRALSLYLLRYAGAGSAVRTFAQAPYAGMNMGTNGHGTQAAPVAGMMGVLHMGAGGRSCCGGR
jgi:hypothetical protein